MKQFYDFSEPAPKSAQKRKIEYHEEKEKYAITTNCQRLSDAKDVISRLKREPRQESVSPLLKSFISGECLNNKLDRVQTQKGLSKTAVMARNEVLSKLGIKR